MSSEALLELGQLLRTIGIPDQFQRSYEKNGVKSVYPWQRECLFQSNALDGNNLVYCAPTGGGKTMVAELVMLKTLISIKKKVIFVLPYVSLVKEKERYFKKLVHTYNCSLDKRSRIRVKGFHGDSSALSCFKYDILVCTIEKSNLIVNTLVRQGYAHKLGCVVVDEMHSLGDIDRGYHLEILISKLKLLMLRHRMHVEENSKNRSDSDRGIDKFYDVYVQLVGLSATVGNISALAEWFGAALFQTDFRPVVLTENICIGREVVDPAGRHQRWLNVTGSIPSISAHKKDLRSQNADADELSILVNEGLLNGQQTLVFCSSRIACQTVCKKLAAVLPKMNNRPIGDVAIDDSVRHIGGRQTGEILILTRLAISDNIFSSAGGATLRPSKGPQGSSESNLEVDDVVSVLCAGIQNGIAFHHAGLSDGQREAVESAYKCGHISVLVCTSTLAAGVNLPAGRVIINGMKIGYSGMLNVIQYRQMCGRAGRAGLSTCAAESYLLVRPSEKNAAMALATAPYPSVVSQMSPHTIEGNKGFLRAILELCSLSLCDSTSTFKLYVEQTLFFREFALNGVVNTGKITLSKPPEQAFRALQFLLNARILKVLSLTAVLPAVPHSTVDHFPDFEFGLTQFGTACVACNMNPDDAIVFYEDLLRAREYLNLENDLHVAYLCSPLYHSLLPNFSAIFNTMTCGDEATPMKRVMAALELEEGLLMKWMHAPPSTAIVQSAADTLRQLKSSSGLLFNGHPGVVKTTLKVNEKEISMICRCKRLWAAQILADMLRSQDALLVAKRYGVPVGDLEQLHKNATMLSAKMVEFAAKLGWTSLSQIMKNFCPRLKKIDNSDPSCTLVDLMSVPGLDIRTAKLFSCSKLFDSCKKIADAQTKDVAQYLRLSFSFDPILPLPGHDSTVAASARCANMTCNDGTDQTITHIDMAISKNSPAKSLSTPSKVFASVAMTPRITRSLSKRDNDEKFADSEEKSVSKRLLSADKEDATASSRKRRRVSSTLLQAFDDTDCAESRPDIVPASAKLQNINSEITAAKAVPREVNERHDAMNSYLLAFAAALVQSARDTIAKRVIEESEPKVLSQSNYLLDNSNTPDSSINDDFGYISDDSDRSTSLSSDGSLVSLCEGNEVQVQSFSAVESEKEILEEIDPHIPPWLRRVMDNDTFHRNNSNNTSKPSLRKHVAVAVQSSAAITGDELVKSFSPRDSISENRLLSEKESDVLQDWLDIPDEQLCNMMNSAERRYSLRQKYLLRSAVNREASAAKIIYHASASAESDFVDLLSSSSAATTKIEFNSPKLDPDNQHIPKEEVLHGNATLNSDEIELQLEIPPDFFGNNVCTEYNDISLACHESAAQQIESFLSPFTPSKVKSANKYISYDFANYSSRKDEHNQSGINVKDEFPTVCSDVLCGQLASGAQPIFFVDLIDLNAASLSICVEFFELMEKSKCVSFDLVFRSVPSFDGLINSDLFQQPRHSKQNNIRNSWNCFIARNPTGPSGVKIIKGKESGGRSSSSIIAGAAIYFGGTSVFYLPLPCPLPLHKFCKNQDIVEQTATLSAMPIEVKILIIRLVGVDAQMNFCVNLSAVYYAVEAPFSLRHNSNEKKRAYSPLLLVSRGFNEACRQAMQEEWRRGCCTEWRILHKIMSSEHITKVGIYVKDQLAALRERDVMTNGFLEDPMIACQLLEIAETSLQMQDVRVTESSDLPISSNSIVSSRLLHAKREACLRAIRVMHIMGKLENELKTKNMMDLFFFVEMPLCNCVCEMEHSGMPFEASLFVNLKQDLSDRCKIIEHYFKLVEGKDFRMTSEKQIGKFKARLGRDILNQALERRGMNIDRHGGTFTGPMDKMFMLSKGLKDHPEEVTTEVATLMMTHPLIQLLSEWRSHSSALATIGSILCALPCKGEQTTSLGSRIRGYVNTIGAASGRMTVVRPPLQQMPHEVAYRPCRRQSVYAEACKAASDNRASVHVGIDVLNHKWNQNLEWVRITPIDRITSTGPFNFVSGKLIELCHDMIMEKSQEHQEIEIETKVKSIISVWRDHGHEYSDQDGRTIFVVKVSCSNPSNFENNYEISESQLWRTSNRSKHLVPADKVFRLSSPIEPHQDELDSISKKSNQEEAHHRDNFYRCVVSPRSGFVASKGFVIMSADYSQIELRILAHFCKDNALLKAFKEEKVDVFKSICSRWKKKAVELVSEEERDSVKQICYAIIYGAGASRISAVAGCTEIEAKYLYQDFLKCHPGVSKFISDVKKDSQKCGFVCTILGRRRHLNGIRSENKSIKAKAERQAVNTICQGSAADLIKLAMVNIHSRLQTTFRGYNGAYCCRRSLPGACLYKKIDEVRMILQIHDELLFEVPERYVGEVASIAVNCMENALQLLVPLKVKVNVGSDWSNLKLYTAKIHGHKYDSIVESEKYVQLNSVSRFIFESVDSQASFNYDGDI